MQPQQGVGNPVEGMPQVLPQGGMPGDQPISEEQRQALLEMIKKVKGQISSFNATKFASGNKTEELRNKLLQQVFEKLQRAGVDLSSQESVSAFIMKLQQDNPELAAMFEKAMDTLLGTPEGGSMETPQDPNAMMPQEGMPENNMNNIAPDETIPQG